MRVRHEGGIWGWDMRVGHGGEKARATARVGLRGEGEGDGESGEAGADLCIFTPFRGRECRFRGKDLRCFPA